MIGNQLAPLYGLKECVMEFPRDSSAFRQTFVEAIVGRPSNLLQAPLIGTPNHPQNSDSAKDMKPGRLEPGRSDTEIQTRAFFVPNAVVVARNNSKSIRPRTEVRIKSLAPSTGVLPVTIRALQLITEANPLRYRQAQGCVVNPHVTCASRQHYIHAKGEVFVTCSDRSHRNRRR